MSETHDTKALADDLLDIATKCWPHLARNLDAEGIADLIVKETPTAADAICALIDFKESHGISGGTALDQLKRAGYRLRIGHFIG